MLRLRSRRTQGTRAPLRWRARRVLGDGLFTGALALVAFLLLCWPFVRTPPLDAAAALGWSFAIWAGLIAALAASMAARVRDPGRGRER